MKKKKNRKRAIKILSLALALVVCVGLLQAYVLSHADHNRERVKGFYLEDKDSIDVVLIGSSEVYSAFASCYAYEKFGYTSYPLATTANIVPNFKTQIETAVKEQHPKLIVVEVNGILYKDTAEFEKEVRFHRYIDNIPLSKDKINIIREYIDKNQWEYYLPILKYHSVWKDFPHNLSWDLTILQDKIRGYNYLKGAKCRTNVQKKPEKLYNENLEYKKEDLNPYAEKELRNLLEYCKSEGIDNIVFTRFPHMVVDKTLPTYYRSNMAGEIIAEYGYDFINFEQYFNDIGLDKSKDFYNPEHLNIYGQRKFTEYFGRLLQEKYGITKSELTSSQKEEWDDCVKVYEKFTEINISCIENKDETSIAENYFIIDKMEKKIPLIRKMRMELEEED